MNGYSEHSRSAMIRKRVDRGLIQVRPLQAAHQLQGVHAGHRQDVSVGIALRRHREHRVRDRAERRRDDRLIELLGRDFASFPALVLPQQAGRAG